VNGWKRVREWLHVFDDTDPVSGKKFKNAKLKIFSSCLGLIEALPSMIVDEKKSGRCRSACIGSCARRFEIWLDEQAASKSTRGG